MIIIGEKLNSSIPSTLDAMRQSSDEALISIIKKQSDSVCDYLDLNTATCFKADGESDELDKMLQIISLIKEHSSCGIMIDSANPNVMAKAAKAAGDRKIILNSLTLTERFDEVSELAVNLGCPVVALPIASSMPKTLEERCGNVDKLVSKLRQKGIADGNIFIDALTETLATDTENAISCLKTIEYISKNYPDVHTICGLSNISFGLPERKNINSAFLSMAVFCGIDAIIADAASPHIRSSLMSALAVYGKDEYCMDYISFIRGEN